MSNVLAYKGYFAPVEFDAEQHVLTGMVAGIRDAIVFEGSTAEEVEHPVYSKRRKRTTKHHRKSANPPAGRRGSQCTSGQLHHFSDRIALCR